jgi:serine/threonine-protein kinase
MQELPFVDAEDKCGETRRVGGELCGWVLEKGLAAGPICKSWVATRAGQRAVLRMLREPFATDRRAREQWLRASWAPNRFHHARIIRVIELGSDADGAPVLAREWAEGKSLEERVGETVLDPSFALRLSAQLLDALETAHAHGIVHGALTPSNVIVTPRGSVRLLDFATAPWLLGAGAGDTADLLAAARVGPFTAPEQRSARRVGAGEASDVWSVGACLYFSLVGRPPTTSLDTADLSRAAGADVAAVIGCALSRDPLERYESAYAMLGDVRRLLAGRKPKLAGFSAPPSQNLCAPEDPTLIRTPSSNSRIISPVAALPLQGPRSEWRGNVLLMIAITLLVGLASFVLVRERLSDPSAAHSLTR